MARPDKAEAVKDIAGRFKAAEAALLTDYRGLRVGDIAEVRNAVRAADADYKVLKNTLTRIAVREVGLDELVSMLEGPTAVAFCRGDAAAVAKALDEAAKKFPVLVIKGGVLAGKIIDADEARRLAKLEPRDVQLAKIVTMMNAPLQQTANVLSALLRDLGSMLAQVAAQKAEQESEHEDSALGGAVPPEEAGEEAAPESEHEDSALGGAVQPSAETIESGAKPGGEEAAEQAKQAAEGGEEAAEQAKQAAEGGEEAAEQAKEAAEGSVEGNEGIDAVGGGENRQGADDGGDTTPGGAEEE
jgi:large subunit ribosomal protein L10